MQQTKTILSLKDHYPVQIFMIFMHIITKTLISVVNVLVRCYLTESVVHLMTTAILSLDYYVFEM